jgi:hypothetical protein
MTRPLEIIRRARSGVAAMPFVMRMLCGGAMLATPVLLVTLVVPFLPMDMNGHVTSYEEMWSSGAAPVLALFLVLGAVASWGLALRRAGARWAAVATPIAPFLLASLLPKSELLGAYQQWGTFFVALPYAIGIYLCLFHISAVKRYLAGADRVRTPNKSLERTRGR